MKASRKIPTHVWNRLRAHALRRDGYQCVQCGAMGRRLEVDHVTPLADGGTDDLANLQTLCRDCHFAKTQAEQGPEIGGRAEWGKWLRASRFDRARPRS